MEASSCSSTNQNAKTNDVANPIAKKRSRDDNSPNQKAKKRPRNDGSSNESAAKNLDELKTKPACKYGAKCYRKNESHWKEYSHPKESQGKSSSLLSPTTKRTSVRVQDLSKLSIK